MMLLLFAEIDPTTQQGVGYAVVALIGALTGKLISLFDDRDKRRHDTRLLTLEGKIEDCERKHGECEKKHAETEARCEKLERTIARIKSRAEIHHPEDKDGAGGSNADET
jgi:hypothetical protein